MAVMGYSPYVYTPATMVTLGDKLAVGSPPTWAHQLSDYGPIATAEEWLAAELGGHSMALITFWLKLLVALAFVAVVLLLDRLLRDGRPCGSAPTCSGRSTRCCCGRSWRPGTSTGSRSRSG